MPRGDGTGPAGMGPMTGRGGGYCAGYQTPGYANPVGGRGFWGFGRRGGGRGYRHWFWATGLPRWARAGAGFLAGGPAPTAQAPETERGRELEDLRQRAGFFESALGELRKRIDELEAERK